MTARTYMLICLQSLPAEHTTLAYNARRRDSPCLIVEPSNLAELETKADRAASTKRSPHDPAPHLLDGASLGIFARAFEPLDRLFDELAGIDTPKVRLFDVAIEPVPEDSTPRAVAFSYVADHANLQIGHEIAALRCL